MEKAKVACEMYQKPTATYIAIYNNTDCATCGHKQFDHKETFHVETVTIGDVTLNAGDVIRLMTMKNSAFNDAVILGFSPQRYAKVSRPYVYASLVGTTCAGPLLGCETFSMRLDDMIETDLRVDTGRTT